MNNSPLALTSALYGGGQRHAPAALPRERPGTWEDPRAGLDGFERFRPHRDSIPGPSNP